MKENSAVSKELAAREEHREIMTLIDTVKGFVQTDYGDEYPYRYWKTTPLSDANVERIITRGRGDEIMPLLENYAKANCYTEQERAQCQGVNGCSFSPANQKLLFKRNKKEEVYYYFQHIGSFCEEVQDMLLDRGEDGILRDYMAYHAFSLRSQRRLKRRYPKLYLYHISQQGLHETLVDEILDQAELGNTEDFYDYITRHELTVRQQCYMLRKVKEQEFKKYILRYGLWSDAHLCLIECRSEDEIEEYLKRHRYLHKEAEDKLACKGSKRLNLCYAEHKYIDGYAFKPTHFLNCLMAQEVVDYEALKAGFKRYSLSPEDTDGAYVMKNGTTEDVIGYITNHKLTETEGALLFARNIPEEMKIYVALNKKR